MATYLDRKIGYYTIRVEVWMESGCSTYAAQASCPECDNFYNSTRSRTVQRAATKAADSLRVHMRKKHKLS